MDYLYSQLYKLYTKKSIFNYLIFIHHIYTFSVLFVGFLHVLGVGNVRSHVLIPFPGVTFARLPRTRYSLLTQGSQYTLRGSTGEGVPCTPRGTLSYSPVHPEACTHCYNGRIMCYGAKGVVGRLPLTEQQRNEGRIVQ